MVYQRRLRKAGRIVHLCLVSLLVVNVVGDIGHGSDHVHIEFAAEALLDYLHVQQAEEAATETEAEGCRRFRLERERGIVQLQFLKRCTEIFEILRLNGIDAGEHHRLHFLESRNGRLAGSADMGDGIAHLHFLRCLYTGDDVSHVSGRQVLAGRHSELEHSYLVGMVFLAGGDKLYEIVRTDRTVDNFEIGYDSPERIEHGVEDQSL